MASTEVNGGNGFRTDNLGGFTGWGVTFTSGVCCDNTYAYCLLSNATNASIPGKECHLVRVPISSWTTGTILRSFTRTTGTASNQNALAIRHSDGLIACRLNSGDVYTFDPTNSYAETFVGTDGTAPSSAISSIVFDPSDQDILWVSAFNNSAIYQRRISTGASTSWPWLSTLNKPSSNILSVFKPVAPHLALCKNNDYTATGYLMKTGQVVNIAGCPSAGVNDGAGNGDYTAANSARAIIQGLNDLAMKKDGTIYALCGTPESASRGVRVISADWKTVSSISVTNRGLKCSITPDDSTLVFSLGETLAKVAI